MIQMRHSDRCESSAWRRVVAALALILAVAAGLLATGASAEALSITPTEISLEARATASIVVTSDGPASTSQLQVLAPPGVTYAIAAAPDLRSVSQPSAWRVSLTADTALAHERKVTFQVRRGGQVQATSHLALTPKPGPSTDTVVKADILFDGESLLDGRASTAVLQVTNLTDYDLDIGSPKAVAPGGLSLSFPRFTSPARLKARSVLISTMVVAAEKGQALATGKHIIGVVVPVKRVSAALPWEGEILVTREITAGVPGMSDIQNVLQIPSFLLLPGLLVITSFFAIFRLGKPATAAQDPVARLAVVWSPWLWIAAISISGAVAYLYPFLTGWWLHVRRQILYGYSVGDVVAVWIGSILLGVLAGGLARGGEYLVALARAQKLYATGEDPLPFLERLNRISGDHRLPYVEPNGARLYRLGSAGPDGKVWAASAIRIEPADSAFDMRPIARAIRGEALSEVIALLTPHLAAKEIKLVWVNVDEDVGPRLVAPTAFGGIQADRLDSIVQERP